MTPESTARREWRFRLCVWLVRDWLAEHGVLPRLADLAAMLGLMPQHTTASGASYLQSYLQPSRNRQPLRALRASIYREAGAAP